MQIPSVRFLIIHLALASLGIIRENSRHRYRSCETDRTRFKLHDRSPDSSHLESPFSQHFKAVVSTVMILLGCLMFVIDHSFLNTSSCKLPLFDMYTCLWGHRKCQTILVITFWKNASFAKYWWKMFIGNHPPFKYFVNSCFILNMIRKQKYKNKEETGKMHGLKDPEVRRLNSCIISIGRSQMHKTYCIVCLLTIHDGTKSYGYNLFVKWKTEKNRSNMKQT